MPQQYVDFAYVKENASFEQVISRYNLTLLGQGPQRTVLCPFHRERNPSCKVELDRKIFHCFGCGAKGNVLELSPAWMERMTICGPRRSRSPKSARSTRLRRAQSGHLQLPVPQNSAADRRERPHGGPNLRRWSTALPEKKPLNCPQRPRTAR